ncbi:MAG: histidine triad nucleotide-binding protein [Pseudomonadales bacterium]|uniref:Diadenosine tetraphosphate (Ap4A) hydrolase and other HIT family hydrolase n=1 Tax=Oleiphilus messinensis TaxID=141451 RepID=A0A1Y0IF56_9GAMM|nr:histidine triad nucleotide-binding protein [Oleiphilus messinensis]ARU58769.1 diadenosine tetraphosphate (Ap4A) hydrolase and other HIT family hydrolase [Oleiphilus messinensis]MCG8611260.1 histidine triad nucleotide-binding protein [Pseudomonadales bacterium]
MADTIFKKIIDREIPADIVYEDQQCLAFKDINPQAPIHLLIIPKKEIATVNDIEAADAAVVGHLFYVAAKLAKELGVADDGYRTVINCNKHGGQEVYHLHVHLLAGKPLGWPPYAP